MTIRKKHVDYICYIKNTSFISIDDLVRLAKMDDYQIQHEYLKLKYGQNDE